MKINDVLFIQKWSVFICETGFFSPAVSRFIACQFALESDFGRSRLAIEDNNFGGMKLPHRRCFYGNRKDGNQFAVYDSPKHFLNDYISWIFFNRPLTYNLSDLESFKLFLRDSGYCPEKDYINRITNIYNQFINYGQTK